MLRGKKDYENKNALIIKGGHEIYTLAENNGVTKLDFAGDMAEYYFEMMSKSGDKALKKIKGLVNQI